MNLVMFNMAIPIISKTLIFLFFFFQLRPFTVPDSVLLTQIGWCGFVLLLESFSPSCCSLISSSVQPWLVLVQGVRSLKRNLPFMMIIAFTIHNMGKIFFFSLNIWSFGRYHFFSPSVTRTMEKRTLSQITVVSTVWWTMGIMLTPDEPKCLPLAADCHLNTHKVITDLRLTDQNTRKKIPCIWRQIFWNHFFWWCMCH